MALISKGPAYCGMASNAPDAAGGRLHPPPTITVAYHCHLKWEGEGCVFVWQSNRELKLKYSSPSFMVIEAPSHAPTRIKTGFIKTHERNVYSVVKKLLNYYFLLFFMCWIGYNYVVFIKRSFVRFSIIIVVNVGVKETIIDHHSKVKKLL